MKWMTAVLVQMVQVEMMQMEMVQLLPADTEVSFVGTWVLPVFFHFRFCPGPHEVFIWTALGICSAYGTGFYDSCFVCYCPGFILSGLIACTDLVPFKVV